MRIAHSLSSLLAASVMALAHAMLLAAITGAAIAAPVAAQSPPANITETQVEDNLQAFIEMALWGDPGVGAKAILRRISKYTGPVAVRLDNGVQETTFPWLQRLMPIAGLDFSLMAAADGSENLYVEFVNRTVTDTSQCFTNISSNTKGQRRARIQLDPRRRICIPHELMHALGFSHAHARDSLMSYVHTTGEPTALDVLAIRILYDSRVKPGMGLLPGMQAARAAMVDILIKDGAPPETAEFGHRFLRNLLPLLIGVAESGNVEAQTQLGFAYTFNEAPEIVAQDAAAGYAWFRRAAEKGQWEAQANVGYGLLNGRGVTADPPEGIRWLRLAADQRHATAQYNLALAYRDGTVVTRDAIEAYKWLSLSSGRGLAIATRELEKLAPTLSDAEIAEGKRRAASWTPPSRPAP
jgi:hypothetical protein